MKKFLLISILFFCCNTLTNAQLKKGSWLIGGMGSFKTTTYPSSLGEAKFSEIKFIATGGYFLIDKLTIGLKPGYQRQVDHNSNYINNRYFLGPFARYYFLKPKQSFNLFSELSYQYGLASMGVNSNEFSGSIGGVAFLTRSVGLELNCGYSFNKLKGYKGSIKSFNTGVGFQFHFNRK